MSHMRHARATHVLVMSDARGWEADSDGAQDADDGDATSAKGPAAAAAGAAAGAASAAVPEGQVRGSEAGAWLAALGGGSGGNGDRWGRGSGGRGRRGAELGMDRVTEWSGYGHTQASFNTMRQAGANKQRIASWAG
jgi:hypothetical protein